MNKLPLVLVSAAVLAACGTAAASGQTTTAGSTGSRISVRVPAANGASELDVNPVNPPITKEARPTPASAVRPQTVTPNAAQPQTRQDRCTDGFGAGSGANSQGITPSGKSAFLPMCLPE